MIVVAVGKERLRRLCSASAIARVRDTIFGFGLGNFKFKGHVAARWRCLRLFVDSTPRVFASFPGIVAWVRVSSGMNTSSSSHLI